MSLPKKKSRKISVRGNEFRWLVSDWHRISDWSADSEFVDRTYLEIARNFGLGDTADVYFNLVIEQYSKPVSKVIVNYYGMVVEGFLGYEQFTQIKPSFVAQIIEQAIEGGWQPNQKGDYQIKVYENSGEKHRPAVLVLPGLNEGAKGYENLIKPIQIG